MPPPTEEHTLEQSQVAPSVNRVDRWRYRSAVHAARVLNSMGRHDEVSAAVVETRPAPRLPRQRVEGGLPRSS